MNKRSFSFMLVLVAAITVTQFSCSKSDSSPGPSPTPTPTPVDCSGNNPGFNADVLPLVQTKCAINSDCHASGSTNSGGAFTNYTQISNKASNIKTQVSAGTMPKTGSITSAQKAILVCWVTNGALNN
jgi:hypothetical protein